VRAAQLDSSALGGATTVFGALIFGAAVGGSPSSRREAFRVCGDLGRRRAQDRQQYV